MKVLIVGLGSIAKKHIMAMKSQFDTCEIYALRSSQNAKSVNGIRNIFHKSEIPSDIDFSIIANPTSEHAQAIELLADLRKPIFIEKPVLNSLESVKELKNIILENQVVTYVGCNLRFHPVIQRLKEEMGKRRPIEMNVYCGSYLPDWRSGSDYREVYSAKKSLGGGVHLDLIHELDYSIYLLGLPMESQSFRAKKSCLEIDSEDIAHYVLDYKDTTAFITLNYYRRQVKRKIECVWQDETWIADLITGEIKDDKGEKIFSQEFDIMDTYKNQLRYFWQLINSDEKPMNDFEEAVDVLKICLN